jgi:hypothetical protein
MNGTAARRACFFLGAMLALGACGHNHVPSADGGDGDPNEYPANYKPEILSAMHAYLNDPTGIRDAAIAEPPVLKPVGNVTRYVVCLKFNPKKNARDYAGAKEVAAVFFAGRFDQFVETPREPCAGAVYAPFPELQKLTP